MLKVIFKFLVYEYFVKIDLVVMIIKEFMGVKYLVFNMVNLCGGYVLMF